MALDVKEKNLIKFIAKRLIPILVVFFSFASYMSLWDQPVRLLGFSLLAIWLIKIVNRTLLFLRVKLFPRDPLYYGKWAIVTGATAGIGEAFAYEMAARGMNVIIISRSLDKLEEVKRGILKETPNVEIRCMAYDYTDRAGADAFFAKLGGVCAELVKDGGLGILVNNVGMVNPVCSSSFECFVCVCVFICGDLFFRHLYIWQWQWQTARPSHHARLLSSSHTLTHLPTPTLYIY
jgi:hypothetical protein